MARDIKLFQDKDGNWDIDFENGDFALTEGLDTALYLSVLGEARASESQVANPVLRRGHFSNIFSKVQGYEIGSLLWFYSQQPNTESNKTLAEDSVRESLQWMLDDSILSNTNVSLSRNSIGYNIEANLTGQDQNSGNYYDSFIRTFAS